MPWRLTGLAGAGASPAQAASGLMSVTLFQGIATIILTLRTRNPITAAWSTPGAALLVSASASGSWPAAVGAFFVTGVLIVVTGLWPHLADLIRRIPQPIAQAMLAGVVLHLVLAPFPALLTDPVAMAPVLLVWLVMLRRSPRWATPAAFVAAAAVIVVHLSTSGRSIDASALIPVPVWTMPEFTLQAAIGIALPLYLVTMASQNIAGVAVLNSFGYEVPWRPTMFVTGIGTVLGAASGGHAINLAAISAALAAGPEAGPKHRRWIASLTAGIVWACLAFVAPAAAALVNLAPEGVVAVVAAVALLPTLGGSLSGAMAVPSDRIAAGITFAVAASGIAPLNVSSAFWALLAGIVAHGVLGFRRPPAA